MAEDRWIVPFSHTVGSDNVPTVQTVATNVAGHIAGHIERNAARRASIPKATVDQMIAKLQALSWSGKGDYTCYGVGTHRERYYTLPMSLDVDDDAKTVDMTPLGQYYP